MNDINKNNITGGIILKIEKIEKNIDEYTWSTLYNAIRAGAMLIGTACLLIVEGQDKLSRILLSISVSLCASCACSSFYDIFNSASKKKKAENELTILKEEYNIPSTKKRTRGR